MIALGHHRRKVVTLGVPSHLLDLLEVRQDQPRALVPLRFLGRVPRDHGSNSGRFWDQNKIN